MEDLSEKEQLEALRGWWSENGNYVMGGIVVGIIIIFGVNQYRSTVAEEEIAASSLYEDVMYAAGTGDLDAAEEAAGELFRDYDASPYAGQARLALARLYMDNARDQDAADTLRGLIESSPDKELAMVARLRLAKILLYEGKAQDVVELIQGLPENAFSARMNEILGDAYVALEQYAEAETAYIAALNDDPRAPTVDTTLVQLKINDLPDTSSAPEETGVEETEPDATAAPGEDMPADESPVDNEAVEAPAEAGTGNE